MRPNQGEHAPIVRPEGPAWGHTRRACLAWLGIWFAGPLGAQTTARPPTALASASVPTPETTSPPARRLLIVGDSLSAEYGLPRGSGWVAHLDTLIQKERPGWQVVNASVSGDTTAGGRTRLPALLNKHQPTLVVIELGGNDALRGLDLKQTEANLRAMILAAQASKAQVVLLGMQMPPNYGLAYGRSFTEMYSRLAKAHGVALLPFFLQGVADHAEPLRYFQPDRIHPNVEAQPLMARHAWTVIKPQLGPVQVQRSKPPRP